MPSTPETLPIQTTPAHRDQRVYAPHGVCRKAWFSQAPELLVAGPAGTGKSRCLLERLYFLANEHPGMRALLVRKTRASLTESGLVTFEEKVVPPNHPILQSGGQRRMRQAYHFPNGSTIVIGGMDQASKTLSTEYDLVFVQEAIELSENDWEMLTRPLRNGVMPWQQIVADTNPDTPHHWLKRRCDSGRTLLLESRHEDNPVLWRQELGVWTDEGKKYIARLEAMTGPRKQRLRYGRWVQAEGVVYEGWDSAIHIVDRFRPPSDWPRYWSIDFGFTNPFTWQMWVADPDERLYLVRQIYMTQRLVEDHAKRIMQLAREDANVPATSSLGPFAPRAILCDHDAEGRATLEKHLGMTTRLANKAGDFGRQAVAGRLRKAGDGKPRLFIMRDSLDERDWALDESASPWCVEQEFDGYVWKRSTSTMLAETRNQPDEPVDKDDHGLDALRYMCAHLERSFPSVPDPKHIQAMKDASEASRWNPGESIPQAKRRGYFGR